MNVRAVTSRTGARRLRSPPTPTWSAADEEDEEYRWGAITARQRLIDLKGGNLFLRSAVSTPEVSPGGVIDVVCEVSNGSLLISPLDPDSCVNDVNRCTKGPFEAGGYCYELEVLPSWDVSRRTTGPGCIASTNIGTFDKSHSFTLTAPPDEGAYSITIRLTADGSGESGEIVRNITVTADAGSRPGPREPCDSHAECPMGTKCKDGTCQRCGFIDRVTSPSQCGGIESTVDSLVILVVLLIILSVVAG